MNTMKKSDVLRSTNVKLLTQIQRNSINNCDFFKFIIYVRGGHSSRAPKSLATPLQLQCIGLLFETV